MDWKEAMAYLQRTAKFGSILGLERMGQLMARLGNPQEHLRCIHIAGTNGKGSTAALLATVLQEAGLRTGMYTSPGLHSINERIQVDGRHIANRELARILGAIAKATAAMEREGLEHPTEFEVLTAAALLHFKEVRCHLVVLEVGLGGRLDSTNIIPAPLVSVITPVDFDHMDILGDTLEAIAREKAGILKKGTRLVLHPQAPAAEGVILREAGSLGIPVAVAPVEKAVAEPYSGVRQRFTLEGMTYPLGLLGIHQVRNAVVVLAVLKELRNLGVAVPKEAVVRGFAKVRWPGRFEVLAEEPLFLADGAHNLQGAGMLGENLKSYFPGRRVVFVMGVLKDKEYQGMVSAVLPLARCFVTVTPQNSRGLPAEDLAKTIAQLGGVAKTAPDMAKALEIGVAALKEGDLLVGFGSLYVLGDFRKAVLNLQP